MTGHGGDVTSLNKSILKRLKTRCLRKAKAVTVVSEHLKGIVQKLAPEIELNVISMGVDASKFGKQYCKPNYFGQGDKKVILFVGRLEEIKGVTYLIEAMKDIDGLLVIVGKGTLREALEKQAAEIKDKVLFLGDKTHAELKTIYASADIFVAPSITIKDGDQEGLGLVILEAMASGLPVVASNSGGITEIIHSGQNGLLCKEKNCNQIAETVKILLQDENFRSQIIENSKDTIKKYGYSNIARQYNLLLSACISI